MIYLASKSPRRRELLDQIGMPFQVVDIDVDETPNRNEQHEDYVCRMAREKALAGAALQPGEWVLGADTAGVMGEQLLVKPADREHAIKMLSSMSGGAHFIISAVALAKDEQCRVRVSKTEVRFSPLNSAQIERYVASGEADDKAGAYGIQGKAAVFIREIKGSYSGVVGLPLFETSELMTQAGIIGGEQ